MNEIICPHCNKAFKVDEAGYADIIKQVRDHKFEEELNNRLTLAEKEKESAVKLAEANLRNSLQEELTNKDKEITELKASSKSELIEILAKKDSELAKMKSEIQNFETVKELAVSKATKEIEKQRDTFENDVKTK